MTMVKQTARYKIIQNLLDENFLEINSIKHYFQLTTYRIKGTVFYIKERTGIYYLDPEKPTLLYPYFVSFELVLKLSPKDIQKKLLFKMVDIETLIKKD